MPDVDERVPQNLKRTLFLPPVAKGKARSNARLHKRGVHAAALLIYGAHMSCFQSLLSTIYGFYMDFEEIPDDSLEGQYYDVERLH